MSRLLFRLLPADVAFMLLLKAHNVATDAKKDDPVEVDRARRREEQARVCGVSVEGYATFHGDRYYPGTKTTEYPGVQIVDRERAWLSKEP